MNIKTIIKTTGFLLSIVLFTSVNSTTVDISNTSIGSLNDVSTELKFDIVSTGGGEAPTLDSVGEKNVLFDINLQGLELKGGSVDSAGITGISPYFTAEYNVITSLVRLSQAAPYPTGLSISVTIPVTRVTQIVNSNIGYFISPIVRNSIKDASVSPPGKPLGILQPSTGGGSGGGSATPPNYSISMEISGGNNLGTVASKELPLNIAVTNIASAPNTGDVVVALAKDSRITDVGTNCGGDDWALDRTNPVAYLFTYTANDKDFPPTTSASSTIVCPVTVTRPTTQSGKLQLNAVLRHGSGDTKTSNDVASIEVTYN